MVAKKKTGKNGEAGKSKAPARKKAPRKAAAVSRVAATGASDAPDPGAADPARPEDVGPADLSGLKDGKLYYRIGEVSQITGVKPYVLRYWESEFRLMAPQKSRSKQRLYRQKDIETVLAIKRLLYHERYTIAGARRRLRELGSDERAELAGEAAEEATVASTARDQLRRVRDELLAIRSLLAAEV
jgi:DNA-binding transcriptional MerR regulator